MILLTNIKDIPSLHTDYSSATSFQLEIDNIILFELQESYSIDHLKLIFSLIDLTSLEGNDTPAKIEGICRKVLALEQLNNINNVAAICVYPTFAKLVKQKLNSTSIQTACVAGAFPSGQSSLTIKLQEISWAIQEGATEIDMVISRGKLLEGKYQEVFDEIVAIKKCCGNIHLKVIIESGELLNNKNIRIASDLAMYAGADFIKTSTGKISEGATYNAVYVMVNAIKEFHAATKVKVGLKAAGGIKDVDIATNYLKIINHVLGDKWINPRLVRFGASSLANNVLNKISTLQNQPHLLNYFK